MCIRDRANAATLFNKQEDYEHYKALAEKIRQAINDKYLNRETGIYASGVQTELSVPPQPSGTVGKGRDQRTFPVCKILKD